LPEEIRIPQHQFRPQFIYTSHLINTKQITELLKTQKNLEFSQEIDISLKQQPPLLTKSLSNKSIRCEEQIESMELDEDTSLKNKEQKKWK